MKLRRSVNIVLMSLAALVLSACSDGVVLTPSADGTGGGLAVAPNDQSVVVTPESPFATPDLSTPAPLPSPETATPPNGQTDSGSGPVIRPVSTSRPPTPVAIKPVPEIVAEPDSTTVGSPEREPDTTPEPADKPTGTQEPATKPDPAPETAAEADSTPKPAARPAATPEPEAKPEAAPEPAAKPASGPEAVDKPDSAAEPDSTPEPTTKPEPDAEASAEPDSVIEPAIEADSEPEPEPVNSDKPDTQTPAADPVKPVSKPIVSLPALAPDASAPLAVAPTSPPSGAVISADSDSDSDGLESAAPSVAQKTTGNYYKPQPLVTWQIQGGGVLNDNYDVELYVVDLFATSAREIAAIQSQGSKVICSFSAGTREASLAGANEFNAPDLGSAVSGRPDELWLDITSPSVRRVMTSRLNFARTKGCDGVDPYNVDGYRNRTGFSLRSSDQLAFGKALATQAHVRGLAIGLRNNAALADVVVSDYDFAINESCDLNNVCDLLDVFIEDGKPVLHIEYRPALRSSATALRNYCQPFNSRQFSTLILPATLDDSYRLSCQ